MAHPTVVMLPGLLCDATVWQAQRQALPHAECIVPDYGLLSSITAMAQHVLNQLAVERVAVVGHSMGGRVALEMARLAPQRIERIALLDTGYQRRPATEQGRLEELSRLELLQLARERSMREMGQRWARGMVHPAHVDAPVFSAILDMIERKTSETFAAQIRALLDRPDGAPVLSTLSCPVLLVCGDEDQWSPLARHQEMQSMIPGSELVVIERAGHMTTMEQPAQVSGALQRWMHA